MLTVIEAAERTGRDPETVRRWIRTGKLRARKLGASWVIEDADLAEVVAEGHSLMLPARWEKTFTGDPHPDWAGIVRRSRARH